MPQPTAQTEQLKLLIVDDQPLNLKLLRTELQAAGHAVTEAANGVDALKVLERESFDGVVSDILMPEMDGFRLCMEVRDRESLRALPFIMYTSTYVEPSDRDLGESFGADAYIIKPAPVALILEALQHARRAPRRPDAKVDVDGNVVRLYSAALTRKLEEKRKLVQRESMQHAITRTLGESHSTGEAMPAIIRALCDGTGWTCGAYWTWDERQRALSCSETWVSPFATPATDRASACCGRTLSPSAIGLSSDEWWTQTPKWIADATLSFDDAMNTLSFATFLIPVSVGSKPAGVLQLFALEGTPAEPALLRAMEAIAYQIGQFLARISAQAQIRRLAHYDFLTGLPNRYLFDELAGHAIAKAGRAKTSIALMFIDLDGFKQVNDVHGHDAGDHVLATFALRLHECLRHSDAIARQVESNAAARLGGDEFIVLIEDFEHPSALETVAKKIVTAASKPFDLAGPKAKISASVGIAVFPDDGASVDVLRQAADSAMYAAKESGKNAYRFFGPVGRSAQDPDRAVAAAAAA